MILVISSPSISTTGFVATKRLSVASVVEAKQRKNEKNCVQRNIGGSNKYFMLKRYETEFKNRQGLNS